MNAQEVTFKGLVVAGMLSTLIACGGSGSGSSTTGDPVVARGVITAIGSIWVNGVRYRTPAGASYSDDDSTSGTASYYEGQMVTLCGTQYSDGSGVVTDVEYEAELEGQADSASSISGIEIFIDESNTNTSLAPSIINGALDTSFRYEVSGYWLQNNSIVATFIKEDDDSDGENEIKGVVESVATDSLTVHGLTFNYSGPTVVAQGDYVEVHFIPTPVALNTYNANKVEQEDSCLDSYEGEAELEGTVNRDSAAVANACPDGGDFLIDDKFCVDMSSVTEWEDGLTGPADVITGIRVEAEGYYNTAGVLIADEIKARGNQVRIRAIPTDSGDGTTFTFFSDTATEKTITVTTSTATDMDDIPLADLLDGVTHASGVEVRGIRTDNGSGNPEVLAISIRAEDADQRNEIRAAVNLDGADESGMTITVLGVTRTVDSSTQLRIEDLPYSGGDAVAFLTDIDDNDDPTDGPNDIVDLRFDIGSSIADQIEIELEDD